MRFQTEDYECLAGYPGVCRGFVLEPETACDNCHDQFDRDNHPGSCSCWGKHRCAAAYDGLPSWCSWAPECLDGEGCYCPVPRDWLSLSLLALAVGLVAGGLAGWLMH